MATKKGTKGLSATTQELPLNLEGTATVESQTVEATSQELDNLEPAALTPTYKKALIARIKDISAELKEHKLDIGQVQAKDIDFILTTRNGVWDDRINKLIELYEVVLGGSFKNSPEDLIPYPIVAIRYPGVYNGESGTRYIMANGQARSLLFSVLTGTTKEGFIGITSNGVIDGDMTTHIRQLINKVENSNYTLTPVDLLLYRHSVIAKAVYSLIPTQGDARPEFLKTTTLENAIITVNTMGKTPELLQKLTDYLGAPGLKRVSEAIYSSIDESKDSALASLKTAEAFTGENITLQGLLDIYYSALMGNYNDSLNAIIIDADDVDHACFLAASTANNSVIQAEETENDLAIKFQVYCDYQYTKQGIRPEHLGEGFTSGKRSIVTRLKTNIRRLYGLMECGILSKGSFYIPKPRMTPTMFTLNKGLLYELTDVNGVKSPGFWVILAQKAEEICSVSAANPALFTIVWSCMENGTGTCNMNNGQTLKSGHLLTDGFPTVRGKMETVGGTLTYRHFLPSAKNSAYKQLFVIKSIGTEKTQEILKLQAKLRRELDRMNKKGTDPNNTQNPPETTDKPSNETPNNTPLGSKPKETPDISDLNSNQDRTDSGNNTGVSNKLPIGTKSTNPEGSPEENSENSPEGSEAPTQEPENKTAKKGAPRKYLMEALTEYNSKGATITGLESTLFAMIELAKEYDPEATENLIDILTSAVAQIGELKELVALRDF